MIHLFTSMPLCLLLAAYLLELAEDRQLSVATISVCKHRSLTVTSPRNPSNTIRIFSSGAYLRLVAAFTLRTNDLVSSLRSWGGLCFTHL